MGTATLDSRGVPVSYRVASGDIIDYISERFGFFDPDNPTAYDSGMDYLDTLNQMRRGGYPWPLYVGDTLNLSAYTIDSVGSIDGVVKQGPPPSPMPPQR